MASHDASNTNVESLPSHVLSEIFATVASSSVADLYALKTCSRSFQNLIEEDDYIYKHVCMQKIPYIPWFITPQESSFLTRCKQSGNPESLFREGMVKFFKEVKTDSGLERLKEASQKGHTEARYVWGMILLCSEEEDERKQGVELLRYLGKLRCVKTCRKKVKEFLGMMWIINRTLFGNNNNNNNGRDYHHQRLLCGSKMCRGLQEIARLERGWPRVIGEEDEDEDISCELCKWDYELRQFYKIYR
ncbi:putative F-box protein At1g67623 [Prosopis cineraria]|uniref:putative F-box protein At1g67623 n=1 Tax=Prosopis cineraria TaxID=364024 RepID=UPI00240FFFB1|nr:putative F-box protein At1g67623 [Prosopis cineraria]